jgi:hypothetical protein
LTVLASQSRRHGAAPLALAAALPFLFLHEHYQPSVSLGRVDADLSDLAVLVVVVAGALAGRGDLHRLVRFKWPAIAWAALAVAVAASTVWGAARFDGYPFGTHATTAAKWIEYMLLAPAVVLIVRSARDLFAPAVSLVGWSAVVTIVGVVQFFGALPDLDHTPAGRRKPSLLGYHELSALSAAALVVSMVVLLRGPRSLAERRLALVAGASGMVGLVLGGAFDALLGLTLATVTIALASHVRDARRLVSLAAVLLVVAAGTVTIRSQAVADGLKLLGIKQGSGGASAHIQSYRQRVLLAYIGGRIFLAHPLLGVGFEGSQDEYAYRPYLAAAKRRFQQPAESFPSPSHPWGVQNAYVQTLSDLGVGGLVVFLGALLVPAGTALARGRGDARLAGVGFVLVSMGSWNGLGLVTGSPIDALTWLGVGAATASLTVDRSLTASV